jgi:hypothetical protein
MVAVRQASIFDLDLIAPLFDAYRQFYRKPADPALARRKAARRPSASPNYSPASPPYPRPGRSPNSCIAVENVKSAPTAGTTYTT